MKQHNQAAPECRSRQELDERICELVETCNERELEDALAKDPRLAAHWDELNQSYEQFLEILMDETEKHSALSLDVGVESRFGEFQLLYKLGSGANGIVYRARQERLQRDVALKVLRKRLGDRQSETRALAKLYHEGIVPLLDAGVCDGQHFLCMQLVEGETLDKRIHRGNVSPKNAAQWVRQLALALQCVHVHGILHRDIKPSNVIIDQRGNAKLLDFGLAYLLENENPSSTPPEFVGTPEYMSPEQARCDPFIGPSSDIYSLGAVLYELLTGTPPSNHTAFHSAEPADDANPTRALALGRSRAADPKVPKDIASICAKCLEKDKTQRYSSAQSLADDLKNSLEDRPVQARQYTRAERLLKWTKRNPTGTVAIVALILLFIVSVSGWYYTELAQKETEAALGLAHDREVDLLFQHGLLKCEAGEPQVGVHWLTQSLDKLLQMTRDQEPGAVAPDHRGKRETLIRSQLAAWSGQLHSLQAALFPVTLPPLPEAARGERVDWVARSWSPDFDRVALTREGANVTVLWDANQCQPIKYLRDVRYGRFSPNGKVLAGRRPGGVALFDGQTGQQIGRDILAEDAAGEKSSDENSFVHIDFSDDGRLLFTWGADLVIRCWTTSDAQPFGKPLRHGDALEDEGQKFLWFINSAEPTRRLFSVISSIENGDGGLATDIGFFWDIETGRRLGGPIEFADPMAADFTSSGQALVTIEQDGEFEIARVWDTTSGEPLGEAVKNASPIPLNDQDAAFVETPMGLCVLVLREGGSAELVHVQTREVVCRTPEGAVLWAVSPTGRHLLVDSPGVGPSLLDTEGEWRLFDLDIPSGASVFFSPDGASLLYMHNPGKRGFSGLTRNEVGLVDCATGVRLGHPFTFAHPGVQEPVFSRDGRRVLFRNARREATHILGLSGGSFALWPEKPAESGHATDRGTTKFEIQYADADQTAVVIAAAGTDEQLYGPLAHEESVRAAAVAADGRRAATRTADGILRMWDTERATTLWSQPVHESFQHIIISLDGDLIVGCWPAGRDVFDLVAIWRAADGQLVWPKRLAERGTSPAADQTAKWRFAADGDDRSLEIVEQASGRRLDAVLGDDFERRLVAISRDGQVVAAAQGNLIRIWKIVSSEPEVEEPFPAIRYDGELTRLELSDRASLLFTADAQGAVQAWRVAGGDAVGQPLAHASPVNSIICSRDESILITRTQALDGEIQIWDLNSSLPIGPPLPAHAALFGYDDKSRLIAQAGLHADFAAWVTLHQIPDADQRHPDEIKIELQAATGLELVEVNGRRPELRHLSPEQQRARRRQTLASDPADNSAR